MSFQPMMDGEAVSWEEICDNPSSSPEQRRDAARRLRILADMEEMLSRSTTKTTPTTTTTTDGPTTKRVKLTEN